MATRWRSSVATPEAHWIVQPTRRSPGASMSCCTLWTTTFRSRSVPSTKQWLARKGPAKIFGKDVDRRERLNDAEAIEWFDGIWKATLEAAVRGASPCDL